MHLNKYLQYLISINCSIFLADLKLALRSETKAWMTLLGCHCNKKYRTQMEAILTFIEEAGKKLSRSITDLDDIRIAMSALKEIRELQISIDSQIGPIEVASGNVACTGIVSRDLLFSGLTMNFENI